MNKPRTVRPSVAVAAAALLAAAVPAVAPAPAAAQGPAAPAKPVGPVTVRLRPAEVTAPTAEPPLTPSSALPEPALASARLSLLAAGAVPSVSPPPRPERVFAGARASGRAGNLVPAPAKPRKPAPAPTAAGLYAGGGARVTGRVGGQPFHADQVTLEGRSLVLRQGRGWVAERQVVVFFSPRSLPTLGEEYTAAPTTVFGHGGAPHVLTSWTAPAAVGVANPTPHSKSFLKGFTLRLRYESLGEGKLRGRISLSLPGGDYMAGGFVAEVR